MASGGDGDGIQVLEELHPPPPIANHIAPHHGTTIPVDPALYGETQALDDPDCAAAVEDWGKTQVLDQDDDDDEAERTVALSDGDGDGEELADDGVSPSCGIKEKRQIRDVVDSDASTDDEGGAVGDHVSSAFMLSGDFLKSTPGSVRKSFAAVRAASLRSSGLAAARSATPKMDSPSESFADVEFNRKEANAIVAETIEMDMRLNGTKHPACLNTKLSEMDLQHKTENRLSEDYNRDETKSRTNNPRVKKLFNEVISMNEEITTKANNINEGADSPCMFATDFAVSGLNYVASQEPSELSQANALDVVDRFLSVNDAGLSQNAETGKTDTVKSPPTSNAKGAQSLAKRVEQRSPGGKPAIFEWIDNLEDEGGGDFFSKIKDTFFGGKGGLQKSHSHPPKPRHFSSGMIKGASDNSGNPSNHLRMNIIHSDSRLELCNSELSKKAHIFETKTKKNLFRDMDEQSNIKSLDRQLEANAVDGDGVFYDIGPNTQVAVEAMEALGQTSPFKSRDDARILSENMPENSTVCAAIKNTSTSSGALHMRTFFTSDSEGVKTRSKQRNTLHSRMDKGSLSISRYHSSSTRAKKSFEGTMEYTKAKKRKSKQQGNINSKSSVNGNGHSKSLKIEEAQSMVDEKSMKKVGRYHSSLRSNGQQSLSKEIMQGEFHFSNTPIAYRTRHSRTMKLLKETEALSSDGKDANGVIDGCSLMVTEREENLLADASRTLKAKRKVSNMGHLIAVSDRSSTGTEVQNIEVPSEKELESRSLMKDVCIHPKRRRTCQMTSGNHEATANLNNPSVLLSGILATDQLSIQQKDKIVKSIPDILDTAKRKKRSVSRNIAFQTEGLPVKTRNSPIESGLRVSSLCRSFAEKDSSVRQDGPILHEAGFSDASNSCPRAFMEDGPRPGEIAVPMQGEGSMYRVEVADKVDKSPKSKVYTSMLTCKTPSKEANAISPICLAQEPLTLSNKCLPRSAVVRELIRLEASEAAPTRILKDVRRRKDMASVRVLFSHHLDEDIIKQQKKILGRLGVPLASSMLDATHFITDKFVRTRNMLEAIALGKPVVTHLWLESCGQASCFIDEKNYILRDLKKEKEIGFSMPVSLSRASQHPLLQGKRVFITSNVKPDCGLIASLVKAAQGQPMERIGRSALKDDRVPDDFLIISCEEDYSICKPLLEKGAEIFSSELILNGIVIQKLEFERHRLFVDRVRRTRSTIWLRREDSCQFLRVTKCT